MMGRVLLLLLMATLSTSSKWLSNFNSRNSSSDLVFVLDRSSNISTKSSSVSVDLILNIVSSLNYSSSRIALVTYGTEVDLVYSDLTDRKSRRWCEFRNKTLSLPSPVGYSALTDALELTERILLDSTSEYKSVIVITASESNVGKSPVHQAFRLKSLHWSDTSSAEVEFHVLALGLESSGQVEAMVQPYPERLVRFSALEDMEKFVQDLHSAPSCAHTIVFPAMTLSSDDSVTSSLPSSSLTNVSVCAWVKPDQKNGRGTIFSYSNKTGNTNRGIDDNIFTLTNISDLKLYVHGDLARTNVSLSTDKWHHCCVDWRAGGAWRLHINGTLKANGDVAKNRQSIQGGGTLELGQLPPLPSGRHDLSGSYYGSITQLHVFSTMLSSSQLHQLSNPDTPCDSIAGDVIKWTDLLSGIRGTKISKQNSSIGAEFDWCPQTLSRAGCPVSDRCWSSGDGVVCECEQNEQLCQSTYKTCNSSYCNSNGTCVLGSDDEKRCICNENYFGDRCEERVCDRCQNSGRCIDNHCRCAKYYLGKDCSAVYKPSCSDQPCTGNGSCSLTDDIRGYECACSGTDLGPNCQVKSQCEDSPCSSGALCISQLHSYICWDTVSATTTIRPASTSTEPLVVRRYNVVLRLHIQWRDNITVDEGFKQSFTKQVEALFSPKFSIEVQINSIREGSVVVDFDIVVYEPAVRTPDDQAVMSEDLVKKTLRHQLTNGSFGPFPANESDLINVSLKKTVDESDSMDGATLGAILGGVLTVVGLVIVAVVIMVYCRFREENEFERMTHASKGMMGYDLSDLAPVGRSTPKPTSPSPVTSFFHRWSQRRKQQNRSDTLQTLMTSADMKDTPINTINREQVITIEVHDNLGFVPDLDAASQHSNELSSKIEHTSLVTRPPPPGDRENELSSSDSDTIKHDNTAVLDDSDFDSSLEDSLEFDYNVELAKSLKELDRVCSDENINEVHDTDDLQPPSGAFSLRRHELVTNIDDVELSDEVENGDKNSPQSPLSSNNDDSNLKFEFPCHVIPGYEVIPTLELPPAFIPPYNRRSRTYSEQQMFIRGCFERQNLHYF